MLDTLLDSADAGRKSQLSELKGVVAHLQSLLRKLSTQHGAVWTVGDPDKELTGLPDALKTISKHILTGSEQSTPICTVVLTDALSKRTRFVPHLKPRFTIDVRLQLAGDVQMVA